MTATGPKVVSIRAGLPFLDTLARGLLARADGDPLKLSETTVLLPTRRACRSLQEAFLRASGGRALLLPRLLPLGDLEGEELDFADAEETAALGERAAELPPPFPPLARQLHLARLIQAWRRSPALAEAPPPSEDQAVRLAAELARLLDQVETEGLDFAKLHELVPEDYSRHWQLTLSFLAILTERWPKVEAIEGKIGPALRRRLVLEAQAALWRSRPPKEPIVVAGSTGSLPATAGLIAVVAALPSGLIVLPGLDRTADEETWSAVVEEPHHPQHGLARLLARLGIGRDRVGDWPDGAEPEDPSRALRKAVVEQALKPAAVPFGWDGARDKSTRAAVAGAFGGVTRIDCASPGEEALTIALILRRALEHPECRAALVTPDRDLARRVAAELARWKVAVDDSAGKPLAETAPGSFLRLTAELAASRVAPLPLLAALKHPFAAGGEVPAKFRQQVRLLEIAALRGPRPAPGFPGLK
ncbi:MAG: double-strand break repair protein AddB, partial [Kiloniellales bacterium]